MVTATDAGVVGSFHVDRVGDDGRWTAGELWMVATRSARIAGRVYALLGGLGAYETADGGTWEVFTSVPSVPVLVEALDRAGVLFRLAEREGLGVFRLPDDDLARSLEASTGLPSGAPAWGREPQSAQLIIRRFEVSTLTGGLAWFLKPTIMVAE